MSEAVTITVRRKVRPGREAAYEAWLKRLTEGAARDFPGYLGAEFHRPGPDGIYRAYDVQRPIWDKDHVYIDGLVGYRTRLWGNRVGATFQLNVRNLQENGRLQPINALPNGAPYQYRIISPRQFILSATFDL